MGGMDDDGAAGVGRLVEWVLRVLARWLRAVLAASPEPVVREGAARVGPGARLAYRIAVRADMADHECTALRPKE